MQTYALLASLPKYLIVYARRSGTSDLNRTILGPVDVEQLNAMKMSALDEASCELHPAASLHRREELPYSLSGTGSEPMARVSHCCPNLCVSFARPPCRTCVTFCSLLLNRKQQQQQEPNFVAYRLLRGGLY